MMRGLVVVGLFALLVGCGNESAAPSSNSSPSQEVVNKALTKTGAAAVDGLWPPPRKPNPLPNPPSPGPPPGGGAKRPPPGPGTGQ